MEKCNLCINANQHTTDQVAACNVCGEAIDCFNLDPGITIGMAAELKERKEVSEETIIYALGVSKNV